jgi:hypothetical protein
MDKPRDKTDIVPIMLRVREDLRQHLEQSAKARRVSLNQEIVDRLEHTRDRKGLFREVLELSYGPRLGGVLMVLAIGMMGAGYQEAARQAEWPLHDPDWLDDPIAFDAAASVAIGLLLSLRPPSEAGDAELDQGGADMALNMLSTIRNTLRSLPDLPTEGPYSSPPPSHDAKIAHTLLGPLVQRLTEARVRFALAVPPDQPEGVLFAGARLPDEPSGERRSDGSDREGTRGNPVITLTHREFGPMPVRVGDDASWWARQRMWIEAVPRGATSKRKRQRATKEESNKSRGKRDK